MPHLTLAVLHTCENKFNNKILKYITEKESNHVFHLSGIYFSKQNYLIILVSHRKQVEQNNVSSGDGKISLTYSSKECAAHNKAF